MGRFYALSGTGIVVQSQRQDQSSPNLSDTLKLQWTIAYRPTLSEVWICVVIATQCYRNRTLAPCNMRPPVAGFWHYIPISPRNLKICTQYTGFWRVFTQKMTDQHEILHPKSKMADGPHLDQVLSSSWDGRPFGHNRRGPKRGGCCTPFGGSCVPI